MTPGIERITAERARPLRQRILRPGQAPETVVYPNDDAEDSLHLGAFDGDDLVSVASLYREAPAGSSDRAMWRLRGMATEPHARRRGHGARLLQALVAHVGARGGGAIWCNARTTASDFYFALDFVVEGDPFELPGIGLHYLMMRRVPTELFDPPAAHSMDTTWFAVDADGVVARFDTGEAGALPTNAAIGWSENPNFDHELFELWVLARYWARELEADGSRVENEHEATTPDRVVLALAAAEDLSYREVRDEDFIVLHAGPPRIVVSREPLPVERLESLRRHGSVLRFEYVEALDEEESARAAELFVFHNQDYDVPGAYVRSTDPEEPIALDDVPPALRGPLAELRLPIRFAETRDLQLADYLREGDVQVWGDLPLRGGPPPEKPRAAAPGKSPLPILVVLVLVALAVVWMLRR